MKDYSLGEGQGYLDRRQVISKDGELLRNTVRSFYDPFWSGKGYNFKYSAAKLKSYFDIPLPSEFTDSELGKIYRLSQSIRAGHNLLIKREGHRIVPLTKEDIRDIINLCNSKFSPFWKKLNKHKILKPVIRNGEEYFCFNPIYYNSVTYIDLDLYLEFSEELNGHLPQWAIERYIEWATTEGRQIKNHGGVI